MISSRMEVFEVKRPRAERQSSTASYRNNSKVTYFLTMACAVLVTCAILLILHFSLEYKSLSQDLLLLHNSKAEKLEVMSCDEEYCNTKDCVAIASRISDLMNPKADPCNDFYEYACGGYSKVTFVPYAFDSYSAIQEARMNLLIDIRRYMESRPSENESQTSRKLRQFYDSCINEDRRNEQQNQSLSFWFSDLEISLDNTQTDGSRALESQRTWRQLLSRLEEYQIHTVLEPRFGGPEGSAPERIETDCRVPYLNFDVYLDPEAEKNVFFLSLYKEVIGNSLKQLSLKSAARRQIISEILQLETDMARSIQESPLPDGPPLSDEHKQQVREIFRPVVGDAVQEMEVVSTCRYNLQNILSILNNSSHSLSSTYIIWRMLAQLTGYLGTEFNDLQLHYLSKLPGVDYVYESKWQRCADMVRDELGLAAMKSMIDAGYIKRENIAAVQEEFSEVKRDFIQAFRSVGDMDETVSEMFLNKLRNMKLSTGYPEILQHGDTIDTVYRDWEVEDNYFINVINLKKFKTRHFLTRLWYGNPEDPISEISLERSPLGSRANYDYKTNTVSIDLGLLLPPVYFYSENTPKYLQYGVSPLLAREMSHAFDATGCFYDAEANRIERIFWPTSLEEKYDSFTSCMRLRTSQLSREFISEVNNTEMLNHIISDFGSFLVSYEGLSFHLRSEGEETILPGVVLTKKQTFYVQAAQRLCELRSKPSSDPYARYMLSPRFRVNGAVSNMEEFVHVFNCPLGSAMNPETKCKLFQ